MDPRITLVIGWMETDLDGHLTTTKLAAAVNLSPSRFTVLFRRETGVSPARYLRALRMERARLLLERTFLTVKEVMAFVGVNDPSHFSRDFRRHHGVSPTRLRERSWAPERWRGHGTGHPTPGSLAEPEPPASAGTAVVEEIVAEGSRPTRPPATGPGKGEGDDES